MRQGGDAPRRLRFRPSLLRICASVHLLCGQQVGRGAVHMVEGRAESGTYRRIGGGRADRRAPP